MQIFEIVWLGVVIELISSNWKVIATCADLYITTFCPVASVKLLSCYAQDITANHHVRINTQPTGSKQKKVLSRTKY